jgi:hypothetical protein
MQTAGITSLEAQAEFLGQCLDAWLIATGRREEIAVEGNLHPDNVAYQGRVVVSFLSLVPACIWYLRTRKIPIQSARSVEELSRWLSGVMTRAGLLQGKRFLKKALFKSRGYLGSGGLSRFRDALWAASCSVKPTRKLNEDQMFAIAVKNRARVWKGLQKS